MKLTRSLIQDPLFQAMLQMLADEEKPFKRAGIGKPVHQPTRAYRIEMANGNGPFNSDLPNKREIYETLAAKKPGFACTHLARANNEQMGITEADFLDYHGDAAYACESLPALNKWFPEEARKYLASLGAKIVVYEVPPGGHIAHVGHGEVIIARPQCRKAEELSVDLAI